MNPLARLVFTSENGVANIDLLVALWWSARKWASTGGTEIDVDVLTRISDLFRFHWDPPVLVVLAERPFRFRALLTRLESHVGGHVDDNALSRSLHRLTHSGLVLAKNDRIGQRDFKVYSLSGKGREHLETYGAFIATYEHLQADRRVQQLPPAPSIKDNPDCGLRD